MTELRLQEIFVENFRSIAGQCLVPLDASITLIHGANGAGKTSLLSAIEFAATGRVGFLEDQTGDARSLLRNDDFPLGQVRLSIADPEHGTRVGSFELTGDRVSGRPALSSTEQSYFLERGFLPQTALGRLLESYTETGKQVDTALVRFVKSLVGLDELDALIDGLHAAGDERRTRKVPAWARARGRQNDNRTRRDEAEESLQAARTNLERCVARLRDLLGAPATIDLERLVRESLERGRGAETTRADLAELEELSARMDALASLADQSGAWEPSVDEREGARAEGAQLAYDAWATGAGAGVLRALNRVRVDLLGLSGTDLGQLPSAYEQTVDAAVEAAKTRADTLATNESRAGKISELDERVLRIDQGIADLEARARSIPLPTDVRVLIEIVQLSIPLVESDRCPLCDERFTGPGTLSEHLAQKLNRLSANSRDLLALEKELDQRRRERLGVVGDVVLLKSLPMQPVSEPLDDVIRLLNGLADAVGEGSRLRQAMQTSQSRTAEIAARNADRAVVARRLVDVSEALQVSVEDLPFAEAHEFLRREIAARIQRVQFADIQRRRERETRESVEDAQRDVRNWELQTQRAEAELSTLNRQIARAESRMKGARDVLRLAETTRSKLINEVFDQSLNGLWAQLFTRFAPSERFTPRFVKQTAASRSVDVRLETTLPDGRTSGSPGAMLSYGNTNSAALALFMALHLSAPPELPWLIFDDPVQSMDDIHVANFAAIVRQLAFVHGRQVVIAIHQPELFDYLALELAPSTAEHSLVRVTLDRGSGATEAKVDRVSYAKEPSLRPAI